MRTDRETIAEKICRRFIKDRVSSVTPFGDGRINDTFLVKTDKGDYICQRLGKGMDTAIQEHNYLLYSEACKRGDLGYPEWMKTDEGRFFCPDEDGDHWRMYPFIEGEVLMLPLSDEQLAACGAGLAALHACLQTFPQKPEALYPGHHDLGHYYDRYLKVQKCGLSGEERDEKLEVLIRQRIDDHLKQEYDRTAVIHGDPKLANMLFLNGRVKAFIDTDTVMQGALIEDIADCARSCCVRNGKTDMNAVKLFADGYRQAGYPLLNETDMERLPDVINKIRFELGLRYYTDAIAKEKIFKQKYPGYLLEKARKTMGTDLVAFGGTK